MIRRAVVIFGLLSLVGGPGEADAAPTRRALLVGCTRYPDLEKRFELEGCGNDARLVGQLLRSKFKFPPANIKLLTEEDGEKDEANLPTRANIERAFKELARVSQPGDKVVIFLAGHGSQQPAENPNDPDYPEPDGLDEIFLPADVKGWDGDKKRVVNAIRDKELARWLKAIRARGATLVVIIDACHSATLVRSTDDGARPRGIPIEKLVPEKAVRAAQERMPASRGHDIPLPWKMAGSEPDLVALYAAQSTETALEDWMPDRGSPNKKKHGLFTYTLVQVLEQAPRPPTCKELIQRIHGLLLARTTFSLPLVEGKDSDREFLGDKEWPGRSSFVLSKSDDGYTVNAGYLHGFYPGSILEVHPPADKLGHEKAIGHVKVVESEVLQAKVEPVAYGSLKNNHNLPEGGYCKPVALSYGSLKLRVALDGEAPAAVREALERLAGDKKGFIEVTPPASAQWLLRARDHTLTLLPAGLQPANGSLPQGSVGPTEVEGSPDKWLEDRLTRIAQARNLVRLASSMGTIAGGDVRIKAELVRYPPGVSVSEANAVPVPQTNTGIKLEKGERFAVRFHNQGRAGAWVTVLFVDSHHGVLPFFPRGADQAVENLVLPNTPLVTPMLKVGKTFGLEHMIVIAVKANNKQKGVDFRWLCQGGVERALKMPSPLEDLLGSAALAFRSGGTRGFEDVPLGDHALQLISFRTLPKDDEPVRAADSASAGGGGKVPWEPVLYLGGGLIAGAMLVMLMNRRRPRPVP